jgi:hypothetical protein
MKLRSIIFAVFLFLTLPLASSFAQVGISVNIAPPVLPVYEQPLAPAPGYIWTPGYWGWATGGYYWVPGVWVAPPSIGLLWTPAWWGWNNGAYIFHQGYWGPTVGFYGGINYGHGYWGNGYWGGHWEGNTFHYNTAVTRVNNTVIHDTYVDRSVVNNEVNHSKTSFNGGNGGIKAEPNAEQKAAAESATKVPPTSQQVARQEAAAKDPKLQASNNKGHPTNDAIKSFNQTQGHAIGGEQLGAAGGAGAPKTENKPGSMAEHQGAAAGNVGEAGNKHETGNVHGHGQNLEGNQAKAHSGKMTEHGNAAHTPHTMNQQMAHHQQQMAAQHHQQQMSMQHHPPMQGGGNQPAPKAQPQGKKKPGQH